MKSYQVQMKKIFIDEKSIPYIYEEEDSYKIRDEREESKIISITSIQQVRWKNLIRKEKSQDTQHQKRNLKAKHFK